MKDGINTSEFWITAVMNIVGAVFMILAGYGIVTEEERELWIALARALVLAIVPMALAYTNGKYIDSRKEVKAAQTWIDFGDYVGRDNITATGLDGDGLALGEDANVEVD